MCLINFLNRKPMIFKLNTYKTIRKFGNKEMLSVLEYKDMLKKVHNVSHAETLKEARELLKAGEVIAVPTDTVYGLACDANNVKAIQKLYDIKGRDSYKPVAICVKDLAALRHYGHAEHISSELLQRLLPGPITIIIERTQNLSNPHLNPSTSKVGIRIPDFQFIQQLCAMYPEQPLALTSANRSAEPSSLNVQEFAELWPQLGGIFDGGQLGITEHQRAASTVIDLSSSTTLEYKIVREGLALKNTVDILHQFGYKPIEL